MTYGHAQYSSEQSMKPDKYNTFNESIVLAGSHLHSLNHKVNSENICTLKEISYNHQIKPITSHYNIEKKISNSSETKNSNWYNKVMNVLCAEDSIEEYSNKKYNIEEIGTLEKRLGNYNTESVVIRDDNIILNDISIIDGLTNKDDKLPQLNQFKTSSFNNNNNNSSCEIQNIDKLIPLNFSYKNVDMSHNFCPDQTSDLSIKNICCQSNNIQSICSTSNSESQSLVNITNKLSDITIENKMLSNDRFSISKSILNQSDKSTLGHSVISNNSSSNIHSSSSSEQDTVIYYTKNSTNISSKENIDSNNLSLSEENVESYGNINSSDNQNNVSDQTLLTTVYENSVSNTRSCYPDIFQFKDNANTKLFNSDDSCVSIQEKFQSNDETTSLYNQIEDISAITPFKFDEQTILGDQKKISSSIFETSNLNVSQNVSRRKRYAGRFQNKFNLDSMEKSICENNIEVKNSMPSFRLEPGKKYRRSILIVRNFIGGGLDQTTSFAENTSKGRNWNFTVDDVLRQQSISNDHMIRLILNVK